MEETPATPTPRASPYDALIIGGGPAGLAAAIYLGRYLRPTLILNEREPRTRWHRPTAHNVLGFPAGIMRSQLLEWGRTHVSKYECVKSHAARVLRLARDGDTFTATDDDGNTHRGRSLILAMGVEYQVPDLPDVFHYAGRTLWHCPECDGYKTRGKPIVVIGTGRGTAEMALNLLVWTDQVTVCTAGEDPQFDDESRQKLADASIPVCEAKLAAIRGDVEEGQLHALVTAEGRELPCAGAFANIPCDPPTELYSQLKLDLHKGRWVKVDYRQRTNIPRCYAAGDICAFAQTQLSVAMGQGATAGIYLHKELLPPSMRLEED